MNDEVCWRSDIDALMFPIGDHGAACAVHRRAFRTLLGTDPAPQDCIAYFCNFEEAFRAAASVKIARNRIHPGMNLHLTSRDVARKLLEMQQIERGEAQ